MPLAEVPLPTVLGQAPGVQSRTLSRRNPQALHTAYATRSKGPHAGRRIPPSASQDHRRSRRFAEARAIAALPGTVDRAFPERGLASECPSFEVADIGSRSVLFYS